MTHTDARVTKLEVLLRGLLDAVRKLTLRADSLEQQARQAVGVSYGWGGGPGAPGRPLWCKAMFPAATGVWPTITPQVQTLDIYSDVSGSLTLYQAGATVRWFWPDSSGVTDKLITVLANGDGSFDAINASCTGI